MNILPPLCTRRKRIAIACIRSSLPTSAAAIGHNAGICGICRSPRRDFLPASVTCNSLQEGRLCCILARRTSAPPQPGIWVA